MSDQRLIQQAAERGIAAQYRDANGHCHQVSAVTLQRLMDAMGPDVPPSGLPVRSSLGCHLAPAVAEGRRGWGLSIQLYGLRSNRNWGIGDFRDLAEIAELAGSAGAAALQLSPLHALFGARPAHCSPYSPSSRRFLNPLYIDVDAVVELETSATARRLIAQPAFQERLAALRAFSRVDYAAVSAIKLPVLRLLFGEFIDRHQRAEDERYAAFERFREQAGPALAQFALFEALDRRLFERHPEGWTAWPPPWRDRLPLACQDFVQRRPLEVLFPMYLQWLAHEQLKQAQQRARAAGMPIGLIADLAVGVDPSGADAWCDQALLALDAEIGAPPDAFAADGQAWGLPPWRPQQLAALAWRPWRELLDANMAAVGGLRIDHVIGCERQFWVPRGLSGRDGAYVSYPREAMLACLSEASRQHQAVVIGEDLGTVPDGFAERLDEAGILSTRVLRFERYPSGLFRRPMTYPDLACACAGTHDLPPLAAWLEAGPETPDPHDERVLLHAALVDAGTEPRSSAVEDRIAAVHAFLAATPCRLVLIQLEDILAEREPANRPGSGPDQPNWQRKYRLELGELAELPAWQRTLELLRQAGRASA
ncbi:MAG: 4-alpha-glucanotransferase [Wenzhouxiangella sp.]